MQMNSYGASGADPGFGRKIQEHLQVAGTSLLSVSDAKYYF
jgi:hypothetical protein